MSTDETRFAMNRAYAFCEQQQTALDAGDITEAEWFDIHCRFFTGHYLAADDPRAQSGHSGDASAYRYTRGMIVEAIDRGGTFLDVGCANGHLIEMLDRWLSGTEVEMEFHGLDISEGLLDLARRRLPDWSDRFLLGNALYWTPPMQWDFVSVAELGYVPRERERELFDRIYRDIVAPDGRLILGPATEPVELHEMAEKVRAWGYEPSGYCEKSHQKRPGLRRRLYWFDRSDEA